MKIHLLFCLLLISTGLFAQESTVAIGAALEKIGVRLDASTNIAELNSQYAKNKSQWDAALDWLAQTDLRTIVKGKHAIEGSNLTASVEDSQNSSVENRASESHYHHIDLQLVVRGVEGFYLLDHESSTPNVKWKEDVIRYDYDVTKAQYLLGHPGTMFLFFPSDWHVAKVQTPFADQTLRVVVIKLDYVE